jgi:hypothetical protein
MRLIFLPNAIKAGFAKAPGPQCQTRMAGGFDFARPGLINTAPFGSPGRINLSDRNTKRLAA